VLGFEDFPTQYIFQNEVRAQVRQASGLRGLEGLHHSRPPSHLGKYEAKIQILSPIKIGQKINANRYAQGQGLTSAACKAAIGTPTQNK
jgi:hypothetical protein